MTDHRSTLRSVLKALGHRWSDPKLREHLQPYALSRLRGSGGFALVFEALATDSTERTLVAKLPRPVDGFEGFQATSFGDRVEALRHEADVLSACQHQGVVQLVENRSHGSMPMLVLEGLDERLEDVIGSDGRLLLECMELIVQVAGGIEAIHAAGCIHGDVKPANILRRRGDVWKLIDPCPPGMYTNEFAESWMKGPERDIVALGRTFLYAYYGYHGETCVPEDMAAEIEEHDGLLTLLQRCCNECSAMVAVRFRRRAPSGSP